VRRLDTASAPDARVNDTRGRTEASARARHIARDVAQPRSDAHAVVVAEERNESIQRDVNGR
jgi:hypothetical protein